MLYPMTELLNLSEDSNSMLEDEFKAAVEEAIDRIMSIMEKSFKYEAFSIECTKHFKLALNNHHTAFIKDVHGMKIFTVLLNYDDRTQLALTLSMLDDLCQIESLQDIAKKFFFPTTDENDEDDEKIVDKIFSLMNHKNLKSEVIALIKSLVVVAENEEFLSEQQRYELFLNVFNKNKKIAMETCALMAEMKVDFWLEVIKMLNYYVEPSEIDIPHVLASFESTHEIEPKTFLEIACNNANDTALSQRAAEMFLESIKMTQKVDEILPLLDGALQTCLASTKAFCFIIECFHEIGHDELVDFFKENVEMLAAIIENIGNALQAHEDHWVYKYSASVLFIFFKVSPEVTLQKVYGMMQHNLKKVLTEADCVVVNRMSALLEIKYWTILNESQLKRLYNWNKKYLNEGDKSAQLYTSVLRLHTNVWKHLWVKLVKQNALNFMKTKETIADVKAFFSLLMSLKDKEVPIDRHCIVIASMLDIIFLFQPKMKEKSSAEIFKEFSLETEKNDITHLVDLMLNVLYYDVDSQHYEFHKKLLLQTFVSLYLNHLNLPTLTVWEAFLRHYTLKSPYKTEVEQMMERALTMERGIFNKTVAFAILNLSNYNGLDKFRDFHVAIEKYLKAYQPDVKARNERFAVIVSFVLEKLAKHYQGTPNPNRLMILDCLTFIIKNLDTHYKKNLASFIKFDTKVKLTVTDKQKLELFKNMLKE